MNNPILEQRLIIACEKNNVELVRKLIYQKVMNFSYAINMASSCNNIDIVNVLLNETINIVSYEQYNVMLEWGLHGACKANNLETINTIMNVIKKHGRNIDLTMALGAACETNNIQLTKLFIKLNTNATPINIDYGFKKACLFGNIEIVKYLYEKYSSQIYLSSGLEYACYGRQLDIVKLLISIGGIFSNAYIKIANIKKDKEMALLLILHGSDINCANKINFIFDDFYYLFQNGKRNFGNYMKMVDKCKKFKCEYNNVLNEIICIDDVIKIMIEF